MHSTGVVIAGLAVFLCSPSFWDAGRAIADEIDVSGSWQMNVDCGAQGAGTATTFWVLSEDVTTGQLTAIAGPECGTSAADGGIHKIASCSTNPFPLVGEVTGGALNIPGTGFWSADVTYESAFASPSIGCVDPPLLRVVLDEHIGGTITGDGGGTAQSVSGALSFDSLTYFDSLGDTCLTVGSLPSACTFLMLRADVAAGSNVAVEPLPNGTVTFTAVTNPGVAAITPLTEADGALPPEFQLLGLELYYDVTTTATISGDIVTCLPYPDADDDGFVDDTSPQIHEDDLQILHEEGGVFVDRTVGRDPVNNQICAETTSLSQHVLGAGAPSSTPVPTISSLGGVLLVGLLTLMAGWALRRNALD
jgi:hypothetical protein